MRKDSGSFRSRPNPPQDAALELPLLSLADSDQPPSSPARFSARPSQQGSSSASLNVNGTGGRMDSHDGIQKLLAAEQEAQAIVTAARQGP
jgi:hypothetical protein